MVGGCEEFPDFGFRDRMHRMGTWHVNGLRDPNKFQNLIESTDKVEWSVAGIIGLKASFYISRAIWFQLPRSPERPSHQVSRILKSIGLYKSYLQVALSFWVSMFLSDTLTSSLKSLSKPFVTQDYEVTMSLGFQE